MNHSQRREQQQAHDRKRVEDVAGAEHGGIVPGALGDFPAYGLPMVFSSRMHDTETSYRPHAIGGTSPHGVQLDNACNELRPVRLAGMKSRRQKK